MRRLFSTFARGWPGAGLVLVRAVSAIALAHQGLVRLSDASSGNALFFAVGVFALAALLLVGLWTPIAGVLLAAVELWWVFAQPGDPWLGLLLGTMGLALALLGPGAFSIDARLFGWKRIDIRARKS